MLQGKLALKFSGHSSVADYFQIAIALLWDGFWKGGNNLMHKLSRLIINVPALQFKDSLIYTHFVDERL